MKILIAEDEAAFRNLLEETLVRWGYNVAVTPWTAMRPGRPCRPKALHSSPFLTG
jgi:hypothetical protein